MASPAEGVLPGRLAHGYWRAHEWGLSDNACLKLIHQVLETGIQCFDHAACYGGFRNEAAFGRALALEPALRERLYLVSKCGILFPNDELPHIQSHYYDNSRAHIIWSAERSIEKLQCGYLDLLLIHRPSPCAHPEEIAAAFDDLHRRGLVRHFGVSNYSAQKFSMLQSWLDQPLVTNQIEISPLQLTPFGDGSLDYLLEKRLRPMAWSPLGGGALFKPQNERSERVAQALLAHGKAYGENRLDTLVYAWLLAHPAGIMPIVGSGRLERIENASAALNIPFSEQEWLSVYTAAQGKPLP